MKQDTEELDHIGTTPKRPKPNQEQEELSDKK